MKKRLFAILTVTFLVLGVAGASASAAPVAPQKSELPNAY